MLGKVRVGRARRIAAAVVVACAAAAPATANAQLGEVLPGVPLPGGSTPPLTTTVEQALCPPAESVEGLLAGTALSPVGEGVASLSCNASVVEHRFVTRFRPAGGEEVVRTHEAVIGVPSSLDVDDDPLADLVATVTFTGFDTVGLEVRLSPFQDTALPVAVEAVLRDTSAGVLGRDRVAVGYDARDDRAPGVFELSTPVGTFVRRGPEYRVDVAQEDPGERIAVIASAFDGTELERVDPTDVRIDFGRSPERAGISADLGEDVVVTLTTSDPGPVTVAGGAVDGAVEERFRASIEDLPSELTVRLATDGGLEATYAAAARVARIRASYEQLRSLALVRKAVVDLDDVPVGLSLTQDGDSASVATEGGPLGLARVGVADGEPQFLSDEPAYVNLEDDGARASLTAQIPGLERATFALGDAPALSAKLASTPFRARLVEPGRSIDARIADLPSEVEATVDVDGGVVRFRGSAPVGLVTVRGTGDTPLFGRASDIDVRLEDLPHDVEVRVSQDAGSADVTARDAAGAPVRIGSIEVAAWNDEKELPAGGSQGAVYRDVPGGAFRIGARIEQLETLRVDFADAVRLQTRTAGGPFRAAIETAALAGDVAILDLPEELDLGVDLDAGQITYRGSAPIGSITADLDATTDLFGGADKFRARFEGVPRAFTVGVTPDARDLRLTADAPIDVIELAAADGTDAFPVVPAGMAGATIDTVGGKFRLAARVFKLRTIGVDLDPVALEATMEGGRRFVVDARLAQPSGTPLEVEADVMNLPSQVSLGLVDQTAAEGGGKRLEYTGSAPVALLKLSASGLAIVNGASDVQAEIEEVPTSFSLALPDTGPVARLAAGSGRLGQVRVGAGSRPLPSDTYPGTARDTIGYTGQANFGLNARLTGIKTLSAQLDPIVIDVGMDTAINRVIDLDASVDGATITGTFNKPGARTRISVEQGSDRTTRVAYGGSALNTLSLRAQNLGGMPLLDARLNDIPASTNPTAAVPAPSMQLCFDSADRCIRANDNGGSRPRGGSRNYQPKVSVDAVTNRAAGFTTLNAKVRTSPTSDTIEVTDLRFRNLAFDFTQGDSQQYLGQTIPRVALYIDTNNAPFVINNITYDAIQEFRIGSDAGHANAQNRFVWFKGISGFFPSPDTETRGTLHCGNRRVLRVAGINMLDIFGWQLVPICTSGG